MPSKTQRVTIGSTVFRKYRVIPRIRLEEPSMSPPRKSGARPIATLHTLSGTSVLAADAVTVSALSAVSAGSRRRDNHPGMTRAPGAGWPGAGGPGG
ncbi:hypothetical protein GCM10010384_41400 [Streptomyces djakartensis]|uniref:Uncharacterized protein n=1 Tax=Streptomyces djakartensis TaxID=68193 RepID=A0ABQ2ZZS6_9ACTN|nr:hypothetical protein GCM10010384_41400 [Streptomyces djakartensis]